MKENSNKRYAGETPTEAVSAMRKFMAYVSTLSGDEKGEAQVFCDRLFQAFGHDGYKEAGATLEFRLKHREGSTKFPDLVWKPRLLLEMKRRGEKLQKHYRQTFDYWIELVPHRPRYVVLCNFDELWVYDFDSQVHDPVDKIQVAHLDKQYTALTFLFPDAPKPLFGNDRVAVTRAAASNVAAVFNSLVGRGEDRAKAQRFILQCVVAMFAQGTDLLKRGLFTELITEAVEGKSTYDLLGPLFQQMNSQKQPPGGRFKGVPYFNGGLFSDPLPLELVSDEVGALALACNEDWAKVEPAIFGTLFQASMDKDERHAFGAHFTGEAEILRVVLPTIVWPWRERIKAAKTLKELTALRKELSEFQVLDPACGSGNFLYVAYRELKRLEVDIIARVHATFADESRRSVGTVSSISAFQFHGIDIVSFAVELAKVTLMIAKKLAIDEAQHVIESGQTTLPLEVEAALPLENLDKNIVCGDALLGAWPPAHAIIGNPPFQSKNKMPEQLGVGHVQEVRARYPDVPGRANYCVYWFRRAHDELPPGGRAGLIGTNQIKSNYSRMGGLDYIVANGGTITEAVASQVWPGDAVVHVSIVNWLKGPQKGPKRLYNQLGDRVDSPWQVEEVPHISSSLSSDVDVAQASPLEANRASHACFQGQTHGDEGFLLRVDEARAMMNDPTARAVLHPYLTGDNLLRDGQPARYCIDMNHCADVIAAMQYGSAFEHIKARVMPVMKANALAEQAKTGEGSGPRQSHYQRWWRFWRGRTEMIERITAIPRYIVCVRHTKRPVFEFVDSRIHPNDALTLFPLADDYSFGILQSNIHWLWFKARCSPIKREWRYTSETVFDAFPWPQALTHAAARKVAKAAVALRSVRRKLMDSRGWNLRALYRTLETPGRSPLVDAHESLDEAVRAAYEMGARENPLSFLLTLNQELAARETQGLPIIGPGLPSRLRASTEFFSEDCVSMPGAQES